MTALLREHAAPYSLAGHKQGLSGQEQSAYPPSPPESWARNAPGREVRSCAYVMSPVTGKGPEIGLSQKDGFSGSCQPFPSSFNWLETPQDTNTNLEQKVLIYIHTYTRLICVHLRHKYS